jgi:hypothetical protein
LLATQNTRQICVQQQTQKIARKKRFFEKEKISFGW